MLGGRAPSEESVQEPFEARMKQLNLILAAVFGAMVAWLAVRSRGPASAPIPAEAPRTAVVEAAAGTGAGEPQIDPGSLRRSTAPPGGGAVEEPTGERVSAAVRVEAGLAENRARLFEALREKHDPKLAELVQMLAEHKLDTPEIAASAWVLADNWGVFAQGEAGARRRIEDKEMFDKLARTRREILIDVPEAELKQVVGGDVESAVLRKIEEIGRKHPPGEKMRKRGF